MAFSVFFVLFVIAAVGALFIIKPIIADKKVRKGIRNLEIIGKPRAIV